MNGLFGNDGWRREHQLPTRLDNRPFTDKLPDSLPASDFRPAWVRRGVFAVAWDFVLD